MIYLKIQTFGGYDLGYGYRPFKHELHCGDAVFAIQSEDDSLLTGIIDGLGHGRKAAEVSRAMQAFFVEHPNLPVDALLLRAHEQFRASQGAVVGLVRLFGDGKIQYVGVGNIACRLVSAQGKARMSLLSKDGVLGLRLRGTEIQTAQLMTGESFVLYSDGISEDIIRSDFRFPLRVNEPVLTKIIETFGKWHDDVSFLLCTPNTVIHPLTP